MLIALDCNIEAHYNVHGKKQATGMIAAPIEINGERRICVVEVIQNLTDKRLYVHEVFNTEKLLEVVAASPVRDGEESVSPLPQGEIAKVLKNIFTAKNTSIEVDENGEPVVADTEEDMRFRDRAGSQEDSDPVRMARTAQALADEWHTPVTLCRPTRT